MNTDKIVEIKDLYVDYETEDGVVHAVICWAAFILSW